MRLLTRSIIYFCFAFFVFVSSFWLGFGTFRVAPPHLTLPFLFLFFFFVGLGFGRFKVRLGPKGPTSP